MSTKYIKEHLLKFSNEELSNITNGKAIDFHLEDGRWIQLCVNDLQGFDGENGYFYTRTGIKIRLQYVDYIEVFG